MIYVGVVYDNKKFNESSFAGAAVAIRGPAGLASTRLRRELRGSARALAGPGLLVRSALGGGVGAARSALGQRELGAAAGPRCSERAPRALRALSAADCSEAQGAWSSVGGSGVSVGCSVLGYFNNHN